MSLMQIYVIMAISDNGEVSHQAQVDFQHFKLMMKQFVIKLFFVH